jgi:tricarballylate dehydrogenase
MGSITHEDAQSDHDVVVVGAGNAALTAALSAAESGRSVLVLEKASEAIRGGNTRFSGGVFRVTYQSLGELAPLVGSHGDASLFLADPYTKADYLADIEKTGTGRADPQLADLLVERSYATVKWMAGIGVRWEFNSGAAIDVGRERREAAAAAGQSLGDAEGSASLKLPSGVAIRSPGIGLGLSDNLFDLAEEAGIRVAYESQALGPVFAETGEVSGVRVRSPHGVHVVPCKSLVVASGGFSANPAMRVAYLGPEWGNVKVRGTRCNTGEMTMAVLAGGAQAYGDWSGCHATPVDADSPDFADLVLTDQTNRSSFPFSVMVNLDGVRFMDEGADFLLYSYARTGRLILQQPKALAFQVFDQRSVHYIQRRYSLTTPFTGNSFAELADAIHARYGALGFNKQACVETLDTYNDAVLPGTFDPGILDGKTTRGLRPADKTNWALKLEKPPYVAYPVTTGITFTYGGLRTDTNASVLDHFDRPIPGLFANGEVAGGFFFGNYPGGAGLTRGAVFGRIAGQNAATFATEQSKTA